MEVQMSSASDLFSQRLGSAVESNCSSSWLVFEQIRLRNNRHPTCLTALEPLQLRPGETWGNCLCRPILLLRLHWLCFDWPVPNSLSIFCHRHRGLPLFLFHLHHHHHWFSFSPNRLNQRGSWVCLNSRRPVKETP